MAEELKPLIFTFGGGINARRRPLDIDINECVDGTNFDLDPQLLAYQKRAAFDLVAVAPNVGRISGYAQLFARDGTITTLIQAGSNVYLWDHVSTFTQVATVSGAAKLRGPREHNFTLDDYVIITDLAQEEVVKKWDGTTFGDLAHNLVGDFFAKYCRVHRERAFYGNLISGSTALPHMIVGSQLSDGEILSTANRPVNVSDLSDPFFLLAPDLRPINGFEEAFGTFIVSTRRGRLYAITGSSAFDFDIKEFYSGSAVSGDEAMINIGNDLALGLPARIESLSGTLNFGDVETDDLSLPISNRLEKVTSWTLTYDRKRRVLFCFPDNQSAVWCYNKRLVDARLQISPWSHWTTGLAVGMQPTCAMQLTHPTTGEDQVYFGDHNGNIFQMFGQSGMDGGTSAVSSHRTSGLVRGLPEGNVMDVEGWILYRRQFAATITLTFQYAGEGLFDHAITVKIPEGDNIAVYNGPDGGPVTGYYGGDFFYGVSFTERLNRQRIESFALNAFFQLRIDIESQGAVDIQEIGFNFRTAA